MSVSTEVRQNPPAWSADADCPIGYELTGAARVAVARTARARYDALVTALADAAGARRVARRLGAAS